MTIQETNIKINKELRSYLPRLSAEDYEILRQSCVRDGIRDALIVWQEEGILVDGYHRFQIAEEEGLDYEVKCKSFESISEVKKWMDRNQLGKRNLSGVSKKIVRTRCVSERDKNQMTLFTGFERLKDVLPESVIEKIMSGEVKNFKESDIAWLDSKDDDFVYNIFEPIIDGLTDDFEKCKSWIRPKTKDLKSWQKVFAQNWAKSMDWKDAFYECKKEIHKVEASKCRQNLEFWRIVFDDWTNNTDNAFKMHVVNTLSMFKANCGMEALDAHVYYLDNKMADDKELDFTCLVHLYSVWEIVDNCPSFLERIRTELSRIKNLRSNKPQEQRSKLTPELIKLIKARLDV